MGYLINNRKNRARGVPEKYQDGQGPDASRPSKHKVREGRKLCRNKWFIWRKRKDRGVTKRNGD